MRASTRRRCGALVGVLAIAVVAACGSPTSTPVAVGSPSATAQTTTGRPTASLPVATATPGRSPTVTPVAPTAIPTLEPGPDRWIAAGMPRAAVQGARAVELGDGRVLAVGWDRDGERTVTELWDPATNRWRRTASLDKNRSGFAMVALRDGRALVIGGQNDMGQSFSSAWAFEPASERWTKVGLMHTARADPAAAVLADGRVLVAGGRYSTGADDYGAAAPGPGALLAAATITGVDPGRPIPADVDPGPPGRALATAELFDPATGRWSRTGDMRFARVGAQAVGLGDGRALVWGTAEGIGVAWPQRAETFDPATDRFTTAPRLPDLSGSAERYGLPPPEGAMEVDPTSGMLLALPGGDALLVGVIAAADDMSSTRTLAFDDATDAWLELGDPFVETYDTDADTSQAFGDIHPDGFAAPLTRDRILVGGGDRPRAVEGLDPSDGTWSILPRLPEARRFAVAIPLRDGSVLLVGTSGRAADDDAYRFIPAR